MGVVARRGLAATGVDLLQVALQRFDLGFLGLTLEILINLRLIAFPLIQGLGCRLAPATSAVAVSISDNFTALLIRVLLLENT